MTCFSSPIGIFDSGIGGLSVLREMQALLPGEALVYVADQAHVPYGPRPVSEIQQFSEAISRFLLTQEAKLIVVACNTASAAALSFLRQRFPHVPFVGMEPAVKPAARKTQTGKVGVLATEGTFASERYADLMARFAQDVVVYQNPCHGLVQLIESGQGDEPETERLLQEIVWPMVADGVDTIVLGCTHYPFVIPVLEKVGGTAVFIIDPAPAVARQVKRVLEKAAMLSANTGAAQLDLVTTGAAGNFAHQVQQLLGYEHAVKTAVWQVENGELTLQFSQVQL
ncbi:MAG: glutamate racemase [Anaerolineae bacterium]|nr:glutamate racemase [Anaerolineae bacterium]